MALARTGGHSEGELDDETLILRIVKNALKVARNQKQVTVRVSPDQVAVVQENLGPILADFPATGFIDVTADSRIKTNGCIVESDVGVVDASIEVQLAAMKRSLMKNIKKAKS